MTTILKTLRASMQRAAIGGALAALAAAPCALAAVTDISNNPLASSASVSVKPNLMYLMDTSGSMEQGHVPDDESTQTTKVGYKNYLCNTLYYNPNIIYVPPKNADGTNFLNATFTAAKYDGFDFTSPVIVNLSTNFIAYDTTTGSNGNTDTAQPAYYFKYTPPASNPPAMVYNAAPCSNSVGTSPFAATPSGTWTKIIVNATSGPMGTDERTNFANWYSYYRTRILMNKSASVRAFVQLNNNFRVGFITINPLYNLSNSLQTSIQATRYLPIKDFDTTQKAAWFNMIYTQTVGQSTPLREAVSRVGRYYAGKTDGIAAGMINAAAGKPDPVQYSCQQNFTILTTDGYWNGNGPVNLAGAAGVGNLDNNLSITPKPLWDGGATGQTTTVDKTNTYSAAACTTTYTQPTQKTTQVQKKTQQVQSRAYQSQTKTEQIQQRTIQIVKSTSQTLKSTSQIIKSTSQIIASTSQIIATTNQITKRGNTTNATANIIITTVNSGGTLTGVNITTTNPVAAAVNRLSGTTSPGGNAAARRLAVANYIAANLTGNFESAGSGNCTGSNAPVNGCANSNQTYVRIMAPPGSNTSITTVAVTSSTGNTDVVVSTSISNASIAAASFADASSCAVVAPTYSLTTNVRTATDCSTRSLTSNVAVATCTAGTSGTGVITTCPAPTVLTTNQAVASCAAGTSGTGVITTCPAPTVLTTNANAASCAAGTSGTGVITTCPTPTVLTTNVVSTSCAAGTSGTGVITTCPTPTVLTTNVAAATCAVGTDGAGVITSCPTPTDTGFMNAAGCTATPNNPTPNGSGQTITCRTIDPATTATAVFVNSARCTPNNGPIGGLTITCAPATLPAYASASTCATANGSSTTNTVDCQTVDTTAAANSSAFFTPAFVNASSCAASGPTNGLTVTCQTVDPQTGTTAAFVNVSSCTPNSGPVNGLTITCSTTNVAGAAGQKLRYTTVTTTTVSQVSGSTVISAGTPSNSAASAIADLDGVCYANAVANQPPLTPFPGIPNPNPQRPGSSGTPLIPAPTAPCTGWPCTTTTTSPGGSTDSLADVASYYYQTDLRPPGSIGALGTDVSVNNVPSSGAGIEDDTATHQHMTLFTMGLGAPGTLAYQDDYRTASTGDFAKIRAGTLNWPLPSQNDPTAIDDLWHAAVDGHGQYFSALDPEQVVSGFNNALAGVSARVASAAAAATSNLEPVAGDNFAYTAKYVTQKWIGELEAHAIDLTTGVVQPAVIWSAQGKLDAKAGNACDNRTIYLYRSGVSNNRVNFSWNTQACDTNGLPTGAADTGLNATEQGNFNAAKVALLSQFPLMTDGTGGTVDQRTPAAGANMVNFLRGQRGLESFIDNNVSSLYRTRDHVLGDIINAQPVYVKKPPFAYDDSGYFAYQDAQANRTPMVYVASNDGMLHAFNADGDPKVGGVEAWAWVPTMVLPNLYQLASLNYTNSHTFFVDGTPTVGDVFDSVAGAWKTILVGGLNFGGKGYYALDITNPAAPKGLWEFANSSTCYASNNAATYGSDCNIGYTFGNPLISKLADGRWAVFVTSGYNNVSSPANPGDGLGYLYVLDAMTGKIIYKISTGVGSAATPSGLGRINSFVDLPTNNTALRIYGGDLLGDLWRFDVNDIIMPAGREATLLAVLKSPDGSTQSVTTKPEVASVGSPASPFVFVATGRYLGTSDLSTSQPQSVYAMKDPLTAATYGDLRTTLKKMTITDVGSGAAATRTIACGGQCTSSDGWYADFPISGERVNVDMKLQLGTIVIESNVPEDSACTIGGFSFLNFFDFSTGTAVSNSTGGIVGQKLSDSLAVGLNIVRLPDGRTVAITTTSDAKQLTVNAPFATPGPAGKRVSWRELAM